MKTLLALCLFLSISFPAFASPRVYHSVEYTGGVGSGTGHLDSRKNEYGASTTHIRQQEYLVTPNSTYRATNEFFQQEVYGGDTWIRGTWERKTYESSFKNRTGATVGIDPYEEDDHGLEYKIPYLPVPVNIHRIQDGGLDRF